MALRARWQDERLSAHFRLGEFACDHAFKPPRVARTQLDRLIALYLEPLRREYGTTIVTSGCRSRAHNERVGGAVNSWHLWHSLGRFGVAADVYCARGKPLDWYQFLDELHPGGLGLYRSFVHVDNRPSARARWTA